MRIGRLRIGFYLAWCDFWVGAFYNRTYRCLYICPLPMVVFWFSMEADDEGK